MPLGVLYAQYGDAIPLHIASRKWALRYQASGRDIVFSTPDHMRFYCLTQYLHWLQCSFSERPKTMDTLVRLHAKICPVCERKFVHEKHVRTCSPACARAWRWRKPAS